LRGSKLTGGGLLDPHVDQRAPVYCKRSIGDRKPLTADRRGDYEALAWVMFQALMRRTANLVGCLYALEWDGLIAGFRQLHFRVLQYNFSYLVCDTRG
jgi:hypothetical protein